MTTESFIRKMLKEAQSCTQQAKVFKALGNFERSEVYSDMAYRLTLIACEYYEEERYDSLRSEVFLMAAQLAVVLKLYDEATALLDKARVGFVSEKIEKGLVMVERQARYWAKRLPRPE